jgi:hypothetical protein
MAHPLAVKPSPPAFYSWEIRTLIFIQKKVLRAKKHLDRPAKDRYKFLAFEDLAALMFAKMWALAADSRVAASSPAYGQIRYRLMDDPNIRRVGNIMDFTSKNMRLVRYAKLINTQFAI